MSHYKHITPEEREKILVLRSQNHSITYIASCIGRDKSTVSRELSRNTIDGEYSAVAAQAAYLKRRTKCRRTKLYAIITAVITTLMIIQCFTS